MRVEVACNTFVRVGKGTVVEVSEAEAKRLFALNIAKPVKEVKETKKRAAK